MDTAELQKFQSEFLDHQLQHTIYQLNELMLDRQSPPLMQEIYSSLLDPATGKGDPKNSFLKHKIAQWDHEFSRLRSVLVLADSLGTKLAAATAERDALNAARNNLLRERAQVMQEMLAKERAMQSLKTELLAIRQSRLWRWTKPLRRLFSLFQQTR